MTAAKVRGGADSGNTPLRMHDTLTHVRGVVQRQQPLGAVVAEQRLVPQVGALLREQNLRLAPRFPTVLRSDHLRESPTLKQRRGFRGVLTTSAWIICVERRIDSSAAGQRGARGKDPPTCLELPFLGGVHEEDGAVPGIPEPCRVLQ